MGECVCHYQLGSPGAEAQHFDCTALKQVKERRFNQPPLLTLHCIHPMTVVTQPCTYKTLSLFIVLPFLAHPLATRGR